MEMNEIHEARCYKKLLTGQDITVEIMQRQHKITIQQL